MYEASHVHKRELERNDQLYTLNLTGSLEKPIKRTSNKHTHTQPTLTSYTTLLKLDIIDSGFLVSRTSDNEVVVSRNVTTQHRTRFIHLKK